MGRRTTVMAVMAAIGVGLGSGAAPASAMFVGVETVTERSASTSAGKSVTVTCPAGKRVMGAGGRTGGDGRVHLTGLRPSSGLTSVTVTAAESEGGTAAAWGIVANAVCAPAPAGLERVAATSPSSSAAKVVSATCPAGKQVLGTGAEVTGGGGQVVLDGIVPSSDVRTVTVNAFEDGTGTAAAWTVTAYAVCGSPAQRVTRASATSSTGSGFINAVTASCPDGRVPVGVGGEIGGGGGQVSFDQLYPPFGALQAGATAWEDADGYAGSWSLTVHLICGAGVVRASPSRTSAGDGLEPVEGSCEGGRQVTAAGAGTEFGRGEVWLAGLEVQAAPGASATPFWATETARSAQLTAFLLCATPIPGATTVAASSDVGRAGDPVKTVTLRCPSGTRALSGAGFAQDAGNRVAVQSLLPAADLAGVAVRVAEIESGSPSDWLLGADALCVPPPPGLARVSRTSAADSLESKAAVATCPAGKHLLGLGAAVSPGTGQVLLDDIRPDPSLASVTVEAYEDRNGYDGDWSVTAYAVCVDR